MGTSSKQDGHDLGEELAPSSEWGGEPYPDQRTRDTIKSGKFRGLAMPIRRRQRYRAATQQLPLYLLSSRLHHRESNFPKQARPSLAPVVLTLS